MAYNDATLQCSDKMKNTTNKSKKPAQSGERIQKKLASLGFGSRRQIERWIEEGLVKVNKKPATIGQHLIGNELVEVKGRKVVLSEIKSDSKLRVIAYHKPLGEVCTRRDEEGRPTVFNRLPPLKNSRWVMIGRLDINTQGLLLFTNNGQFANNLMHPRNGIEREYLVRVFGEVSAAKIKQLESGVMLEDGMAAFDKVIAVNAPSDEEEASNNNFYRVVLTEGKNREVRRLWEAVDCQVSRLKRIRYGSFEIPKTLNKGKTIDLTERQVNELSTLINKAENKGDAKDSDKANSKNNGKKS